jgi:Adenylate and Guanylate cyclase catalytic domain
VEERKVVTVLFCDLVGFTARSDQADPEDVRAFLRPYHVRLRREVERLGGTVDKFIGDGVMAVFGVLPAGLGAVPRGAPGPPAGTGEGGGGGASGRRARPGRACLPGSGGAVPRPT